MRTISRHNRQLPRPARSGRRGVSTIIGITIFLLIFAIAVSYTFAWNQQVGNYLNAVKTQVDLNQQQASEKLIVSPYNDTFLTIYNPTVNTIVVREIRTGGQDVWNVSQGIPPYSSWSPPNIASGNGNFEVVTVRGNIFSGSASTTPSSQVWQVSWYWNNVTAFPNNPPKDPLQLRFNNIIGQTYWYDVNINWNWRIFNNPVIAGNIIMKPGVMMGFVANTTMIKLSDSSSNATINYFIAGDSNAAVGVDGSVPTSWGTTMNITGPQYSTHVVTVYFYFNGTADTYLQLNVVNATFATFVP
jgi:hypothetical protein